MNNLLDAANAALDMADETIEAQARLIEVMDVQIGLHKEDAKRSDTIIEQSNKIIALLEKRLDQVGAGVGFSCVTK